MKLELDLASCDHCGVLIDNSKVEKKELSKSKKYDFCDSHGWYYIEGFICPVCKYANISSKTMYEFTDTEKKAKFGDKIVERYVDDC